MSHVAVVLPGSNYGPDKPALARTIAALEQIGAVVLVVAYPGGGDNAFQLAEAGNWQELSTAITPQLGNIAGADRVTLVAKSLGTALVPAVDQLLPTSARAIYITPLFEHDDVRAAVIDAGWQCLSVFGTADPAHNPQGQAIVTRRLRGTELPLAGANHRLEVPDDPEATERGYLELERAVHTFLRR